MSKEDFPVEFDENKQDKEVIDSGLRKATDLDKKELKLFKRLFKFMPQAQLMTKFRLANDNEYKYVINILEEQGEELEKDESYSRSVVLKQNKGQVVNTGEIKGTIMTAFMNVLNEDERRSMMNFYEEGGDPVNFLRQILAVQATRAMRGTGLEQNSHTLQKTVNEAFADLTTMIVKLQEMEEGQKIVHGFDDTFVGILLATSQRINQENNKKEDDIIDI
jgi:hypothetical protein